MTTSTLLTALDDIPTHLSLMTSYCSPASKPNLSYGVKWVMYLSYGGLKASVTKKTFAKKKYQNKSPVDFAITHLRLGLGTIYLLTNVVT